ncbi:Vps54-like protein [Neofusicoccum parvum]|uniref:Vps54-like protein n=1 Tax=Neofusicoccum parvum TaxID=310453 RepID=A0ACB5SHT6_9PEZI|nr:Vps54-like protein [Neofusicoccum parvum]
MDGYLNKPVPEIPAHNSHLQEELMQSLDMSSLLGQAVDAAQNQITKILKVRGDQSIRLPLQRFLRYFLINRLFADEYSQIKQFVTTMGQMENQKLRQTMDADKWEAKDFGDHENEVLTRILEAMNSDPAVWVKSKMIWEDLATTPTNDANGTNGEANGAGKTRNAVIDEEKYVLVNCAMYALDGIDRFENLIAVIPSITSEVAVTLLDYLRTFQSRTCQLILGAGAKESAGLKSITTKHLALASQALNFIIALIPYIREFIRRHSSNTSLAELDKMRRLYQDQQTNIHEKLIEIMTQRLHIHVNAMKKIDFDAVAQQQTSAHMETLTKETNTFHRTLSRHLPEPSVKSIIMPVFTSYREQWGKAFREALVRTGAGKARLLRDAELFESKLNKIDGFGDIGTYVTDIVKEKVVEAGATTGSTSSPSAITEHARQSFTSFPSTRALRILSMDARKGFLPVTPACSVRPTLSQSNANVTQDIVASAPNPKGHRRTPSKVDSIRDGLRRYVLSAPCEPTAQNDWSVDRHPGAPFSSEAPFTLYRATPSSPTSSASSHASSRSRDELRADIQRIIPPASVPAASYRITNAPFWPKTSTLSKPGGGHSRNSSRSSTSTHGSSAISVVPELTPSKSDGAFDTVSTRKSFAPAGEDERLYGPLVDENCFDFDEEIQVPEVTWSTTTKDDPFLLNNVLDKANQVWSGDASLVDDKAFIRGNGFTQPMLPADRRKAREQEQRAKQFRLQREKQEEELRWQELKRQAVEYQIHRDAVKAEMKAAQEAHPKISTPPGLSSMRRTISSNKEIGSPPGLPSKKGRLSAAKGRPGKSSIGQQLIPQDNIIEEKINTETQRESNASVKLTPIIDAQFPFESKDNDAIATPFADIDQVTDLTPIIDSLFPCEAKTDNDNEVNSSIHLPPVNDNTNEVISPLWLSGNAYSDYNSESDSDDEVDGCAIESYSTVCPTTRRRRYS